MTTNRGTGRQTGYGYRRLADELRRRLVDGLHPPASRLPTKKALCGEHRVSDLTVQRALNVLKAEGFLRSRGRLGMWVVAGPPHLCRVGVVVPGREEFSQLWDTIIREVRALDGRNGIQLPLYLQCAYPVGPDYARLLEDIRLRRLAGLMLISAQTAAGPVLDPELLQRAGLPQVVLTGKPSEGTHSVVWEPSYPAVLAYLRRKGRKRLGLIGTYQCAGIAEAIGREAASVGLQTEPRLTQLLDSHDRHPATGLAELMLGLPHRQGPDALYILDDHLVTHATLGVLKSGIACGPDKPLEVLAAVNFPNLPSAHVPVTFHGYDIHALMTRAMAVMAACLRGEAQPAVLPFAPVFGAA